MHDKYARRIRNRQNCTLRVLHPAQHNINTIML
nr:MAG TPA: hypothetical protein [Caudoviricetes sp.]